MANPHLAVSIQTNFVSDIGFSAKDKSSLCFEDRSDSTDIIVESNEYKIGNYSNEVNNKNVLEQREQKLEQEKINFSEFENHSKEKFTCEQHNVRAISDNNMVQWKRYKKSNKAQRKSRNWKKKKFKM